MILEELPRKLKKLRESANLGQNDLARMAGVTQAQISNYESGKQFPGVETAVRLAAALGLTLAEFVEQENPRCAAPRPASKEEMALWILEAIGISQVRMDQMRQILGVVPKY